MELARGGRGRSRPTRPGGRSRRSPRPWSGEVDLVRLFFLLEEARSPRPAASRCARPAGPARRSPPPAPRSRQVLVGEGLVAIEVVVEAVLDDRPLGDPGSGEQFLDRLGGGVGRGVAQNLQRFGVLGREDRQAAVAVEWAGQIDELAVDAGGNGGPGQAGADLFGDLEGGARRPPPLFRMPSGSG